MDSLSNELTASGVLTEAMVEWARVHQSELGIAVDTACIASRRMYFE